jgi:hypothetical protein
VAVGNPVRWAAGIGAVAADDLLNRR